MKYMILIFSNPMSRQLWKSFSQADRAEGLRAYEALTEDLAASGELIVSEALADPSMGQRLEVSEGKTTPTDGPFAEAKEHLAGFYLIQCESFERAMAVASRVPEADLGLVEVRPVMDLSGFEM